MGWRYLRKLGARWLKPRPHHVQADLQAQAEFKPHSSDTVSGRTVVERRHGTTHLACTASHD